MRYTIDKTGTNFRITSPGGAVHTAHYPRSKREAVTWLCSQLSLTFIEEFKLLQEGFVFIENGKTKIEVLRGDE